MTTGQTSKVPRHVAVIMDGNGRWAVRRGLNRVRGHRQGVETVREIVRKARDMGISHLTLFSFSTENWSRPRAEIGELFTLLKFYIRRDLAELHQNNCRVRVIGERSGLPDDIPALLTEAERLTAGNDGQTLIIAFNYGSRAEIANAARDLAAKVKTGEIEPADITPELFEAHLQTSGIPDPDLVIRTSGEHRISNFLLWQSAYSEFVFEDKLWPDFTAEDFEAAIANFGSRERRYGGVGEAASRETGS